MDFSSPRKRPPLILELTPLIDVVFLLLIFFMVSTTFAESTTGIDIELPRSASQAVITEGNDITVILDADGRLLVDGQPLSQEQLAAQLRGLAQQDPDSLLILRADRSLSHGRIVGILDFARDLGLTNFAIATDEQAK